MRKYKNLNRNQYKNGEFEIFPIRSEDRFEILKWRNEQIYHLRQNKELTSKDQDKYFKNVVDKLFDQEFPDQILFSFLKSGELVGYGGLVHINWIDMHAEISFIMETKLEKDNFVKFWMEFLKLIETVAFEDLKFHKIFTFAFDLRPLLYDALTLSGFGLDGKLTEHSMFDGKYLDVIIHSKLNKKNLLRDANFKDFELAFRWANNSEIRKFSFRKEKIKLEDHVKWFLNKLNNPNCKYYILEVQGVAAGSIRFDLEKSNNALVSYLLDPNFFGKGLGSQLLSDGVSRLKIDFPQVEYISGYVMPENIASIKIFNRLGFKEVEKNNNEIKFQKLI